MNKEAKRFIRQKRIKEGRLPSTAGYRWSTKERKSEFIKLAREEELLAKSSSN